jgi:hypothetical protein
MAFVETVKIDADKVRGKAANFEYATGCKLTMADDGVTSCAWENGNALVATDGGSVGYIGKHMHIHVKADNKHYSMWDDYDSMLGAGIDSRAAIIVVMSRSIVCSMEGIAFSVAETVELKDKAVTGKLTDEAKAMLDQAGAVVSTLLKQSITILALNGISMLSTGHHYDARDSMWKRFNAATKYATALEAIGITTDIGVFFHDMFHPVDIKWLGQKVSNDHSVFLGHIQGVALIRLGQLPAGCASVGILEAISDEVGALVPKAKGVAMAIKGMCGKIRVVIKKSPLEFCAHYQTANTAENLAKVAKIDVIVAFMLGVHVGAELKKSTATAAKSLDNLKKNHQIEYQKGVTFGEINKATEDEKVEMISGIGDIIERQIQDTLEGFQ